MDPSDIKVLDSLVAKGNINSYIITDYGVDIEFIDGTTIAFSACGGEGSFGDIGLCVEDKDLI